MTILRNLLSGGTSGGSAGALAPAATAASSSALTLAFTAGARETAYQVTLNQNCAITVGPAAAGQDQLMTVDLIQGGAGGYTASFVNASWPGGTAPALNTIAGKQDTVLIRGVGADIMAYAVSVGRLPLVAAAPGAPAGVTATAGVGSVTIAAAAVSAWPAVTGYTIYEGGAAGGEGGTPLAAGVALPWTDTGRTAGVARFYKVAAVNAVGTGAQSAEVSATPTAAGAAPTAPASITVTPGVGQNSIAAAAVSASPAVTGYTIVRGTAAGGEGATPIASNVALPYVDTGLTAGTAYFYKVAAVNGVGTGPYSSEGSGTPTAPAASGHRYWRLNIASTIYGGYASIAELAFAATAGGANLLTNPGAAYASSVLASGSEANKALDGNPATFWNADADATAWWAYDFGAGAGPASIAEIRLQTRGDSQGGANCGPSAFSLQHSDDNSTWTTVKSFTVSSWGVGATQTFEYP